MPADITRMETVTAPHLLDQEVSRRVHSPTVAGEYPQAIRRPYPSFCKTCRTKSRPGGRAGRAGFDTCGVIGNESTREGAWDDELLRRAYLS